MFACKPLSRAVIFFIFGNNCRRCFFRKPARMRASGELSMSEAEQYRVRPVASIIRDRVEFHNAIQRCKSHASVGHRHPCPLAGQSLSRRSTFNPHHPSRHLIPRAPLDMNVHHSARHPGPRPPRPTPRAHGLALIVGPPPYIRHQKFSFSKYSENKASKDESEGCQTAHRFSSKDGQLTLAIRVICIWQMVSRCKDERDERGTKLQTAKRR